MVAGGLKLRDLLSQYIEPLVHAMILGLVGVSVGLGNLLNSKDDLTARVIAGRAIVSGSLGVVAGALVIWIPGVPVIGQIAIAAALASLGTSGVERVVQTVVSRGAK